MMTTAPGSATVTLQGDTDMVIARRFAAPPALVFDAVTKPELVRRWWSKPTDEWIECVADIRVGGAWRYEVRAGDGAYQFAFRGEYRELVPGERIVSTEVFEPVPDGEAVNTVTFADDGEGGTIMTTLVHHSCAEHRDMHLASGMEGGMQEAYDRLAVLVGSPPAHTLR